MIDKTLKILICFILFVPLLGTNVSATTNYNHEALFEYEGYGKAMYESIVEQTNFITGQYTDNQQYVNDSMSEIKDYANFWYDEFTSLNNGCFEASGYFDCLGNMVERGGAYVLTVGDWVKDLFTDYDETQEVDQTFDHDFYSQVFRDVGTGYIIVNPDWVVRVSAPDAVNRSLSAGASVGVLGYYSYEKEYKVSYGTATSYPKSEEFTDVNYKTLHGVITIMQRLGYSFTYEKEGQTLTPNQGRPSPSRVMRDYVNDNPVDVVIPELKPSLVCPDGTKVNLSVTGSTFLSNDGKLMHVNKDGTATVDDVTCNLKWDKPDLAYIDDKVAVTDSDGNWLELLTGEGLVCTDSNGCDFPVKPLDNSLLGYIKNAYDYATSVLKNATDGLKSLATGAKDLTALFGTFFSWLPTEIVVLMTSGLGITIGLRLFRK